MKLMQGGEEAETILEVEIANTGGESISHRVKEKDVVFHFPNQLSRKSKGFK